MRIGFASAVLNPEQPAARFGPGNRTLLEVQGDLVYKIFALEKEGQKPYLCISCPVADFEITSYQNCKNMMEEKLGYAIDLSLCATHTHYSVNVNQDPAYRRFLAEKFCEIYSSMEMKEYANLTYDRVIHPFDQVGQGRISGSPASVYIETLCLYDDDQRIATFITYNSHPTTLNFFEDYFSSVGPGLLQKKLEENYPDEFFSYFIGAAGDVSTRFARKGQTYEEVERLTGIVFDEVNSQLQEERERKPLENISFEELWLPVERKYLDISKLILPENASEREKQTIAEAGAHNDRAVKEEDLPKQVLFQRLTFGDFSYIFTPFEMFSEYLDSVDLNHAIIVNCVNDHACYLSGLNNKYLSFELFGESIAYDSKLKIIKTLEKWSS